MRTERTYYNSARRHGYSDGKKEGYKEGREEGLQEGVEEGRKEGREEGRKEGHELGVMDERIKNAKAMKGLGIPIESICKVTGMSASEIESL